MSDSVSRFLDRAQNYLAYRPRYPQAILPSLQEKIGLSPQWTVVDVGSGTGFLAEVFLQNGNRVIGVEPNAEMRQAGETHLDGYTNFESVDGRAEATGLAPASADLATVGQAFHWFNPNHTRREFMRILRPPGWVVLVWNSRRAHSTPFLRGYEQLLRDLISDYARVTEKNIGDEALSDFFGGRARFEEAWFENVQNLTWEELRGRALSSSYAPQAGDPAHAGFVERLRRLYDEHEENGRIAFEYDTRLYWGCLHQ